MAPSTMSRAKALSRVRQKRGLADGRAHILKTYNDELKKQGKSKKERIQAMSQAEKSQESHASASTRAKSTDESTQKATTGLDPAAVQALQALQAVRKNLRSNSSLASGLCKELEVASHRSEDRSRCDESNCHVMGEDSALLAYSTSSGSNEESEAGTQISVDVLKKLSARNSDVKSCLTENSSTSMLEESTMGSIAKQSVPTQLTKSALYAKKYALNASQKSQNRASGASQRKHFNPRKLQPRSSLRLKQVKEATCSNTPVKSDPPAASFPSEDEPTNPTVSQKQDGKSHLFGESFVSQAQPIGFKRTCSAPVRVSNHQSPSTLSTTGSYRNGFKPHPRVSASMSGEVTASEVHPFNHKVVPPPPPPMPRDSGVRTHVIGYQDVVPNYEETLSQEMTLESAIDQTAEYKQPAKQTTDALHDTQMDLPPPPPPPPKRKPSRDERRPSNSPPPQNDSPLGKEIVLDKSDEKVCDESPIVRIDTVKRSAKKIPLRSPRVARISTGDLQEAPCMDSPLTESQYSMSSLSHDLPTPRERGIGAKFLRPSISLSFSPRKLPPLSPRKMNPFSPKSPLPQQPTESSNPPTNATGIQSSASRVKKRFDFSKVRVSVQPQKQQVPSDAAPAAAEHDDRDSSIKQRRILGLEKLFRQKRVTEEKKKEILEAYLSSADKNIKETARHLYEELEEQTVAETTPAQFEMLAKEMGLDFSSPEMQFDGSRHSKDEQYDWEPKIIEDPPATPQLIADRIIGSIRSGDETDTDTSVVDFKRSGGTDGTDADDFSTTSSCDDYSATTSVDGTASIATALSDAMSSDDEDDGGLYGELTQSVEELALWIAPKTRESAIAHQLTAESNSENSSAGGGRSTLFQTIESLFVNQ